jgi:serine/threonine-protein kinase
MTPERDETAEFVGSGREPGLDAGAATDVVEELFHAARDVPAVGRLAFLEARCDDPSVRAEVLGLLALSDGATRFLEAPPALPPELFAAPGADLVGRTIGDFTLLEPIGQGGMGIVFRAEQRTPRRFVALKLVRPGVSSDALLRRLEFEADVLGRLRHPGIAAIHAAGRADLGRGPQPYVAMELVDGLPLRRWLEERSPDRPTRVRVLAAIAEAVEHAHRNGIIHRDLKPENILVEQTGDGPPRPRVLDFGVARFIDAERSLRAEATVAGQLVGTLAAMSPEQIRGEAIDTRSDVHALGLIAWEVFAGRPARVLGDLGFTAIVRMISETVPERLDRVDPDCPLDLALIVDTALALEPARRYASAREFALDLERFLRHEPIAARRPTPAYVVGRYARRHPAQVGGAAAVLAVAIVAFLAIAAALVRANAAEASERTRADEANAVAEYILRTLNVDAQVQAAGSVDVERLRGLLGELEAKIDALADRPLAQARLLNTLADRRHTLNDYARARELFVRSIELSEGVFSGTRSQAAEILRAAALHGRAAAEYFLAQGDRVRLEAARDLYREALAARVAVFGSEHSDTALSMRHLAAVERALGELGSAERLYRQSLEIHERLRAAGDPLASTIMVASGYNGLASFFAGQGRHADAEPLLERALELMRSQPEAERRAVDEARVLRNLAMARAAIGAIEAADRAFEEAEAVFRQQLGDHNREVAISVLRRAQHDLRQGRRTEALRRAGEVLTSFPLAENDALRIEAAALERSAGAGAR